MSCDFRKQLQLKADYSSQTVDITCNGTISSFIDNTEIIKGQKGVLSQNETLYIFQKMYPHAIVIKRSGE